MRVSYWTCVLAVGSLIGLLLTNWAVTPDVTGADTIAIAVADTTYGASNPPDAAALDLWSDALNFPREYAYAIAWHETRANVDPRVRGKAGEWGRFQIMPSTARERCAGMDVTTAHGNRACFFKMTRDDYLKCGGDWWCVAKRHNGGSAYANRAMRTVQQLVRREIEQ